MPSRVPFQLRRKPGTNNALGRVNLMFPNSHDVYLPDTRRGACSAAPSAPSATAASARLARWNFSSDIYGHDEKLLATLDGKSLAW